MSDQALPHVDDPVRPVGAQPGDSVVPDRELHPGAPAQADAATLPIFGRRVLLAFLVTRHGFHRDLAVQASDPPQLLADHRGLERALGGQGGVLPVATAAAAGARVRAGRRDPVGRRGQDLHRLGPHEASGDLGDAGHDPLPRQRVAHEEHRSVGRPGNAPSAVGHVRGRHLDNLTGNESRRARVGDHALGLRRRHEVSPHLVLRDRRMHGGGQVETAPQPTLSSATTWSQSAARDQKVPQPVRSEPARTE